jgi:hypothetical protein
VNILNAIVGDVSANAGKIQRDARACRDGNLVEFRQNIRKRHRREDVEPQLPSRTAVSDHTGFRER